MDVGGGLGVDYDGSQTNFESSMNYTLQEYANDVVYHMQTVCDEAGVPHPTIVSESGRAVVAYHSLLVFNVLGVSGFGDERVPAAARTTTWSSRSSISSRRSATSATRNALESYHDAQAGARHGDEPVLGRLSPARAALPCREPVLGDLREAAEARAADGRSARGPAGARRVAVGHVLLQLLAVPVDSRQLGDQAAVPDHADPPAERAADAARRARRHHLRLRRQDRSVHRPSRRQADAAAARVQRRAVSTSACSWSAPIRRSSATSTTCSATRTPCTSASTTAGNVDARRGDQGRHGREVLDYVEFDVERWSASSAPTSRRPSARAASTTRSRAACSASTRTACTATRTSKSRTPVDVPDLRVRFTGRLVAPTCQAGRPASIRGGGQRRL